MCVVFMDNLGRLIREIPVPITALYDPSLSKSSIEAVSADL